MRGRGATRVQPKGKQSDIDEKIEKKRERNKLKARHKWIKVNMHWIHSRRKWEMRWDQGRERERGNTGSESEGERTGKREMLACKASDRVALFFTQRCKSSCVNQTSGIEEMKRKRAKAIAKRVSERETYSCPWLLFLLEFDDWMQ